MPGIRPAWLRYNALGWNARWLVELLKRTRAAFAQLVLALYGVLAKPLELQVPMLVFPSRLSSLLHAS